MGHHFFLKSMPDHSKKAMRFVDAMDDGNGRLGFREKVSINGAYDGYVVSAGTLVVGPHTEIRGREMAFMKLASSGIGCTVTSGRLADV